MSVQENIACLDIAVYDTFGMRVPQRIGDQADRGENEFGRLTGDRVQIGAVYVLLTIECAVRVVVEFECARNMGVHQANIGLPLGPQALGGRCATDNDLQRHLGTRHAVFGKPGLAFAASAQPAVQGVSFG